MNHFLEIPINTHFLKLNFLSYKNELKCNVIYDDVNTQKIHFINILSSELQINFSDVDRNVYCIDYIKIQMVWEFIASLVNTNIVLHP